MLGSVAADASEPLLPLTLLGTPLGTPLGGAEDGTSGRTDVEAVIDTGFDGELTLLEETIRRMGYPYSGTASGTLADGSEAQFDYYEGLVLWHGVEHPVAVIAAAGQPLIGMALLRGSRLTVDAEPGGEVRVEERP